MSSSSLLRKSHIAHALLGQSLSHKTAIVGEPTQSSDVVTERLP
jgi:hypothetical protein